MAALRGSLTATKNEDKNCAESTFRSDKGKEVSTPCWLPYQSGLRFLLLAVPDGKGLLEQPVALFVVLWFFLFLSVDKNLPSGIPAEENRAKPPPFSSTFSGRGTVKTPNVQYLCCPPAHQLNHREVTDEAFNKLHNPG